MATLLIVQIVITQALCKTKAKITIFYVNYLF